MSRSWMTEATGGFPLTPAQQSATLLFETLWPQSWHPQWGEAASWRDPGARTEKGYMTASPFGEMFDVLSPHNLTAAALRRYRVLVLAGDVEVDVEGVSLVLLSQFVTQGGSLVLLADLVKVSQVL